MSTPIELELRPGPRAISLARRAVDQLAGVAPDSVLDNVRLIVSELITNSVRHAGLRDDARIGLRIVMGRGVLRGEVTDPGPGFVPKAQVLTMYQQSGWGLFLVDQIADRWGVERNGVTRVWFEIDRPN
ncbi:MAG: ATP-binding protein [Actinomycetota bacterium]|nr:ATP-binding protein [Actinomycetota bacterium]